jgi:endonuclease I
MAIQGTRGCMVLISNDIQIRFMRHFITIFVLITFTSYSQVPSGYYDSAAGLTGQQLRAALQLIIDDHQEQTYASIWTHFQSTDDKENGKVWDMYSDIPGGNPAYSFTFITDQCGNYSAEGDCYNREHSFPKSWFNDAAPMLTDLFHIYPTDGFVNGKRSNYPYGEVNDASWTSTNGCEVGTSSYTGYTGTVFEPIDEYKGDFARTYFYMMVRYMDLVSSWNSDMLSGNDLAAWARDMLLEWDVNDPVSPKEIDRNNTIFQIQNNRNPFIDLPEFSNLIWGTGTGIQGAEVPGAKMWYSGQRIHIERNTCEKGIVTVINILGQPLESWQINSERLDEHVDLPRGVYLLIIKSNHEFRSMIISI